MRISIGQFSTSGRKDRNDDSYGAIVPSAALLSSHGIALAIADGLSSSDAAKAASESCVKSFLDDYYGTPPTWAVKKSAATVLKATNSWLYAQGQGHVGGMMTTFSGVIIKASTAHVFHVGDSRIGRLREGRIEPLTRDHRRGSGRERAALSRAFGSDHHIEVDYRSEPLEAGDVLVFTTDGVHEHLSNADLMQTIAGNHVDLDAAAKAIVETALSQGSPDNLTCQLVRIDDAGKPDAVAHLGQLRVLPFPPELSVGMAFDGYRVLREIHTSKRTQVYLAEDMASGRRVVLKTPSVNFEDDPAYIGMFAREEWVGRTIASPHVVSVVAPDRPRRHLYTLIEFVDGQTLRQWMFDNPRPSLEAVRGLVEQIAKGLRAFHRKDILHQDLKPENVMIDRDGLVKIIDFGSAHAAGAADGARAIGQPSLAGTVDYIAPEYHLGQPATNRSDLYALAAMTYEMLTGHLPYGTGFTSARDVGRRAYVSARQWRDDIPAWMDHALEKAVHRNPTERTEALSAFVEDLRRPNPNFNADRPRPLLERNPLGFWRALALAALALNMILVFMLSR